jgi:hypothetical protein
MYSNNKMSWWLYGAGLVIVLVTHVYMLTVGLPAEQMMGHGVLNLIAACLLAWGWLSRKA